MSIGSPKKPVRIFRDLQETDPASDFTVIISSMGPIPAYESPTIQNRQDAKEAIAMLTFPDLLRLPPFQIRCGTVRLRIQGASAGLHRVWTLQVASGVAPNRYSKISEIVMDGNLTSAATPEGKAHVLDAVQAALLTSLNDAARQEISGANR